ncbi:glycerol-3-phosphate 1-O-acyltransferase PlsY [Fodinicurvata sp. EGI_FJ10296]|uniref:glycerol-3-phosphate 1-O-acyltransferase PlsY n=1 Tax=Fodinicurvata sp. EGI_FJ10296 TaxID=3231908 RepID=UPI0034515E80
MFLIDPISWSFAWPYLAAALAGGYLLGSIPFGIVLTSLAGHSDIRREGSGNIGATNVLRVTGSRLLAAAVLILDAGKGAAAVLVADFLFGQEIAVVAGVGAMVGHIFPVWIRFAGGKGVATALGTLLAIVPAVGALACLTWLLVAATTRYSSLAAIVSLVLAPIYAWILSWIPVNGAYLADPQLRDLAIVIAVLVLIRHVGNIVRLLRGTESRIGQKSKVGPGSET